MSGPPNPLSLLNRKTGDLPKVEQLGTIDLKTLNKYHCDNPDRRLICLFGKIYDVTAAEQSYGSDGAYKGGVSILVSVFHLTVAFAKNSLATI